MIKNILENKYPDLEISESGEILRATSAKSEYELFKFGVAARIISAPCVLKLKGADTVEFIHRISTNDVKSIEQNKKADTLFLNEKGRIIDKAAFLNLGDSFFLTSSDYHGERLKSWINRYVIREDISAELSDDLIIIEFFGLQSGSFMTMILDEHCGSISDDDFLTCDFDDFNVYVFENKYPAASTYSVIFPKEKFERVMNYLFENSSVFNFGFVGKKTYDLFRIKNGIPGSETEVNDSFNPYDVNLIDLVSFSKGCYIGQEVVARIDTYSNTKRNMFCIAPLNGFSANPGEFIYNENNDEVGQITSSAQIDFLNKNVALCVLNLKLKNESESYYILQDKELTPAKILDFPARI